MSVKTLVTTLLISGLGLLTSMQSYAFGLGNIEVFSALNEPFNAKVTVTGLRIGEGDDLNVKLASQDDFDKVGIERLFLLTKLKFRVVNTSGDTYIIVKSKDSIKEPFLDFLITATTGVGRLLHEYTVLLDPPKQIFQQSRANSVKPAVRAVNDTTTYQQHEQTITPAPYTTPVNSVPVPVAQTAYQPQIKDQGNFDGSQYGPTGQDDTLWTVAKAMQTDNSVTVQQVAMAIFAENPHAFINNDINILKMNATLKKPELATIQQLSSAEASARFYGEKPVQGDLVEPTLELLTSIDEDEVINNMEEDVTQSNSDKIDDLSNQLDLAVETIEAQKQESEDYQYRMDTMLEQLDTMNKLMALKDAELARLQKSLEQQNKQTAPVVKPPVVVEQEQDNVDVVANIEQEPSLQSDYMALAKNYLGQIIAFFKSHQLWLMLAVVIFLVLIFVFSRRSKEDEAADNNKNDRQENEAEATIVKVTTAKVSPIESNNVEAEETAQEDDVSEEPEFAKEQKDDDFGNEQEHIVDKVEETAVTVDDDFDLAGDVALNSRSIVFNSSDSSDDKVDSPQVKVTSLDDELSSNFDTTEDQDPAITSFDDALGFEDEDEADSDLSLIAIATEQEIEQLLSDTSHNATDLSNTKQQDITTDLRSTIDDNKQIVEDEELDSFDLDDMDTDFNDQNEVDVKLELAEAYIEMDDIENAKSVLNEVFDEGREGQKLRAQTILDSL